MTNRLITPLLRAIERAIGRASRHYTVEIVDASANTVTIASASGNIDGSATKALSSQWQTARVVSDGANWFVV